MIISKLSSQQNFTANPEKRNGVFGKVATTKNGNKYYETHLNQATLPIAGALLSGNLFYKNLLAPAYKSMKEFDFSSMKNGCKDVFKGMGKIGAFVGATLASALFIYSGMQIGKAAGRGIDDYCNELRAKTADTVAQIEKR